MPERQRVTLSVVAERAGVSLATASRVLGGSRRVVGEELRERVLAAAKELSYIPDAHARAMARGSTNVLGLIVHDIADPYFSAIATGVTEEAEQRGMVVLLANTHRDTDREIEYVSMLRAQKAQAILVVGSRWDDGDDLRRMSEELSEYISDGGRVATISQNRLGVHTVLPQNRAGAKELGREMWRLGHRRFVVLAGPRRLLTARDRLVGFREAVVEAGGSGDDVEVVHGPFTRDGGYEAAGTALDGGLRATCVFAVNDVMAMGVMAALRDRGVTVPDDVSLAGFDDIETLRDVVPSLTTVHLPLREMGSAAAELALDSSGESQPRIRRIRGTVVLRDSTRRVDGGAPTA